MSGQAAQNGNASRVLEGKLAIITGGSRGIGAAIATNLASKGANVVINYTSTSSESKAQTLATTLSKEHSIRALAVRADMRDLNGAASLVSAAKSHFSDSNKPLQIDILINNAGVAANHALEDVTPDEFARQYEVNVRGPLLMVQAALPHLPHDRSGRVVNVSSVSATGGFATQTVYGGTKAALEAMTRTWSRELAERATVNAINPGPVATDMWAGVSRDFLRGMSPWIKNTPLAAVRPGVDEQTFVDQAEDAGGRPGYDAEIAGVVAMLCLPDAAWTTGSTVCANGGMIFTF